MHGLKFIWRIRPGFLSRCTPSGVHGLKSLDWLLGVSMVQGCTPSGVHGLKFCFVETPGEQVKVALRLECMD